MKTKIILTLGLLSLLILNSCTESSRSKLLGYGEEYKIELVNCDGTITHSWTSTGKVKSESESDGYYFKDKVTERLVEVSGTLIITEIKNE